MLKKIFIFLFLFSTHAFTFSFKDQIQKAQKGDYIVTYQNKLYSFLIVDDISNEKLILSEISIPQNKIKTTKKIKNFSWKKWIQTISSKEQSFYTAYNIYEIDIKNSKIFRCYSVKNNCFYNVKGQDNFLTTLLSLPFNILSTKKRKKIGPPPLHGDIDRRVIWNPPLIIDGIKQKKPQFDVYQVKWPKDNSDLSGKILDLYFSKNKNHFFVFPFWIQTNTAYMDIILKIVDSGTGLFCEKKIPL